MPRPDRRSGALAVTAAALLALALAPDAGTEAAFSAATGTTGTVAINPDFRPPVTTALSVLKAEGGTPGFVRQGGGTYTIVANVVDDTMGSNPPAQVGPDGVKGTSTSLTAGAAGTNVNMPASVTVPGFNRRSAPLALPATLAATTTASISSTSTDQATPPNTQLTPFTRTVTVDNVAPTRTSVTITPGAAPSVTGTPDLRDTVSYLWSEPVEAHTVLTGWTGAAAANITVRITNNATGGTNDILTVWNDANTAQLTALGSINLGDNDYVAATTNYGATGTAVRSTITWSPARSGFVVTLGTPSATPPAGAGTASFVWTPGAGIIDYAGGAATVTAYNDPSTARNF